MSNPWVDEINEKKNEECLEGSRRSLAFYSSLRVKIDPEEHLGEEVGFEATVARNRGYKPGGKTKSKLANIKK